MRLDATWPAQIEGFRHELSPLPLLRDKPVVLSTLARLFQDALLPLPQRYAIAFSGGLDCTLLAFLSFQFGKDIRLYTVGMDGSQDLSWAQAVARHFRWPLTTKVLTLEEVHRLLKKVRPLLPRQDVVTMSVGAVGYAVLQLAQEHGHTHLMTGLGAEELFAGYDRHAKQIPFNNVHEESWRGLTCFWQQDLQRDLPLFRHFQIEPLCPFLDESLLRYAMQIHPDLKITLEHKKIILRELAESVGIPHEFAWRKKTAAQYGSAIDKALSKLAKRHGFKEKGQFLTALSS